MGRMDKIRHSTISGRIDPYTDDFPSALGEALSNALDVAVSQGTTVDWATLRIEPGEVVFVVDGAGERQAGYHTGMNLTVDSIAIEEVE